jgi:GntR family transcriptional regulator, carbon starvation induced regulator
MPETELIPETTNLAQLAYQRIRNDILQGQLKPEEKLKINVLRERYGTGASPLREALSQLTSDGLVTRLEQRGFRVARANSDDLDELVQARCWIESQAVREAIRNGGAPWEHAVVIATYDLTHSPRSVDKKVFRANPDWERFHKRFHMSLISGCANRVVIELSSQLYDRAVRYRSLSITKSYARRDVPREHQELADAALSRDADRAVTLLCAHYKRTASLLVEPLAPGKTK